VEEKPSIAMPTLLLPLEAPLQFSSSTEAPPPWWWGLNVENRRREIRMRGARGKAKERLEI
ncbi:MAG: hypothetical protein ACP5NY_09300, partial [Thermocladium sp.]